MTISAYDLGRRLPSGRGDVTFGMDRERTAAELRSMADKIEAGEFVLQSGSVYAGVRREDYAETVLVLKVHERREKNEAPPKAMSA